MPARKKPARKKAALKKAARKVDQKRVSTKAARKPKPKAKKVAPIPKGSHTVTASLCFQDADFAIAFYEKAFGAKEIFRLTEPGGKVGHAEIRIGDSVVMMSDEYPDLAVLSAKTLTGCPIRLSLTVKNPDAFMARAVASGATVIRPMQNEFYGWRGGVVMDPFGYTWLITCQVEVISPKQMQSRWNKMIAAHKPESSTG
jgi:PhnB protein